MPTLFIVLISFFAYAAGAVAARRDFGLRAGTAAHGFEVLFATAVLAGIVVLRHSHRGIVYSVVCVGGAFLLGLVVRSASLRRSERVTAGTREFEENGRSPVEASAWKRWIAVSRAVVDYQFRLLLVASYFLLIAPVAIAFRLTQTDLSQAGGESTWNPRSEAPTLDAARRPF